MSRALLLLLALAAALTPGLAHAEGALICGKAYSPDNPWSTQAIEKKWKGSPGPEALLKALHDSPLQKDAALLARFEANAQEHLKGDGPCCSQFVLVNVSGDYRKKWALFDGAVPLYECGPNNENAAQLDELRYIANAIEAYGRSQVADFMTTAKNEAKEKMAQYDRYLFDGFPLYPWEAAVNGWFLADDEIMSGPPAKQLVLLHPSLGAELRASSLRDSRADVSLALEPLGFIRYTPGSHHRSWSGFSLLTTFRRDMGIGLGFAARYQNFLAGVVWHDDDGNNRPFDSRPFVFVGLDLYQFAGEKLRRYDAIQERVKKAAVGH